MLCPLCNGLASYQQLCSACGGELMDYGRSSDWTGPYEPYEPLTSQSPASAALSISLEAVCCHVFYCGVCDRSMEVDLQQWESG
ncbi:hypothetical protein [Paenibacillus sp. PL2-23]|uniref:hypothetical protein n=1 Tax=Paenibacillus sp. PL2-23 TaxID=2100729 RepID=UPI0030FD0B8E